MSKLRWGETPWDTLSREELLREVQRMYAALVAGSAALRIASHGQTDGYWGPGGTGGDAIEMARQILEPLHERHGSSETVYRAFFRYAVDLLFERTPHFRIGFGWVVCPKCNRMVGDGPDGQSHAGRRCADVFGALGCGGVLRPLQWSDLEANQ